MMWNPTWRPKQLLGPIQVFSVMPSLLDIDCVFAPYGVCFVFGLYGYMACSFSHVPLSFLPLSNRASHFMLVMFV